MLAQILGVIILVIGLVVLVVGIYWCIIHITLFAYGIIAPVFGLPMLDFWQVAAIYFLLSLVGGFFKSTSTSSK